MEYGIQFAETGHLVLATLHANSANQALDRIINFFPDERREQLLMDLSLNIRALISQRLIPRESGSGRIAAMEIMLNSPLIQDLIFKGEVAKIKEVMSRSTRLGMKTFDQCAVRAVRNRLHFLRRRACATPTRRTSCACASSSRASARRRTSTTAARCASSKKNKGESFEHPSVDSTHDARHGAVRRSRRRSSSATGT